MSNYEIELVHGGDESELKAYLKNLWKKLAEEHKLKELQKSESVDEDDGMEDGGEDKGEGEGKEVKEE